MPILQTYPDAGRAHGGIPWWGALVAAAVCAVVGFLLGSILGTDMPVRVAIVNDTYATVEVFDCDRPPACAAGAGAFSEVLSPTEATLDFWTGAGDPPVIGVATASGRLIGCLSDPAHGKGSPPTRGVEVSAAVPCRSVGADGRLVG